MKLALLSNVTVDMLAGMLKKTCDVYLTAGFDTWKQEILQQSSGLYDYKPDVIAVLLYADAYGNAWNKAEDGAKIIDEWGQIIQLACAKLPGVPVFVSTIDISGIKAHYGAEFRLEGWYENRLNEQLHDLYEQGCKVYPLPVKDLVESMGRGTFYSKKMWYIGSMPYSMKGLSALSELILRYCSVVKGAKKKCLAVDLDNTLWGGVIGEDGVEGIELADHKEGARYRDTQLVLKKMREQGVMLAIISKNNVQDVEPVFAHPDMILQHDDFVAEKINWDPKCVNIRMLAKELNIGLDSFVFLDDNPAEREQMIAECPEVTVIDFPKDTTQLADVVEGTYQKYFFSLDVTGEDMKKTSMYRSDLQRKAELATAVSFDDYLKKLEMDMDIHLMKPEEEKRVTQLVNKTNQFNVTTKRYSEEEIHRFAEDENIDVITVHISDKYGDQGLVSLLIIRYEGSVAEIDTFLMSCRVMGRNVENEIMARVKERLVTKNIETVLAQYIKTPKNAPVADLFPKLGFETVTTSEEQSEYQIAMEKMANTTGIFMNVSAFEN